MARDGSLPIRTYILQYLHYTADSAVAYLCSGRDASTSFLDRLDVGLVGYTQDNLRRLPGVTRLGSGFAGSFFLEIIECLLLRAGNLHVLHPAGPYTHRHPYPSMHRQIWQLYPGLSQV